MKLLLTLACSSIFATGVALGNSHTPQSSAATSPFQSSQVKAVQSDTTVIEFISVTKMPKYKGGLPGFHSDLYKSLVYPKKAREAGQYGRVFVTFIVELDGSISNAKVARGIGKECDEAALDAVKKMSFEGPAYLKDKPVRMLLNTAIIFGVKKL
jgi:protein TonB